MRTRTLRYQRIRLGPHKITDPLHVTVPGNEFADVKGHGFAPGVFRELGQKVMKANLCDSPIVAVCHFDLGNRTFDELRGELAQMTFGG